MSYIAPIKDMVFNMEHLAGLEQVAQIPAFEDMGVETAQAVLEECAKLNESVLVPLNWEGDKNPSFFKDGQVTTTPGFKDAYTTPVKLRLERRRDHLLVFSKDGYESQTIKLMHVISEAVAGNTLCWGPLGWVFDICAGTQYKLQPSPIHVVLKQR